MTYHDHLITLSIAVAALIGLAIIARTLLSGWREWVDLKRSELNRPGERTDGHRLPSAERIEMAHLRERVRKLEAIAAGVDP